MISDELMREVRALLAQELDLSPDEIQRALDSLIAKGLIAYKPEGTPNDQ